MIGHAGDLLSIEWLQRETDAFMERWAALEGVEHYWRPSLFAVASAEDRLFRQLATMVAEDHLHPRDLLDGARSVISYFLPFKRELSRRNSANGHYAARSWAESYVVTNRLINAINDHFRRLLNGAGHQAAVTPPTHNFDQHRLLSRWSHKHIAYIAGLGTFGHHHLLITRRGCCGRLGSFVTDAPLTPTARPETPYCLREGGGACLACVDKCTYGALRPDAFDRHQCYAQLLANDRFYPDLPLVDVCGKCACNVPCSFTAPGLKQR